MGRESGSGVYACEKVTTVEGKKKGEKSECELREVHTKIRL